MAKPAMPPFFKKPVIISLFCFLGGSICALAMAPYNIWPTFLLGFGVLYWAIDRAQSKKAAFGYGWLWAFGYFLFSLSWIGNALLVEGNPYQWAYPLAVCGLPALLAFFNAFACLTAHQFLNLKRLFGYLGFVGVLSLFEYLRGHVFTGFPWNLYGYTWIDMLPIAQIASFESIYFLSLLTLFWLSGVGFFVVSDRSLQKRILSTLILISFFASFHIGGRMITDIEGAHHDKDVAIKIVQPNTDQSEKWERNKMEGHFLNVLRMSAATVSDEGQDTLIIWPETTLPPQFLHEQYRDQIAGMLNSYRGNAVLMTGALRHERAQNAYYNSLLIVDESGDLQNIYNKSHLVPFGEYIPFQEFIPLAPVTQFQGFQTGNGVSTFTLFDDTHYSPLICYEILFPHNTIAKGSAPDFIVNVTNDAWYGESAGPYQHLVKAQFRAIEENTPVLRAANTGVSAIISSNGRVLKKSQTFTQDILPLKLPPKTGKPIGNGLILLLLFPMLPIILFILGVANTHRCKHNQKVT